MTVPNISLLTLCEHRLILSGRMADTSSYAESVATYVPGIEAVPALTVLREWLAREERGQPDLARHVSAILTEALRKRRTPVKGTLAAWQKRKALDLLGANLTEPVSIESIAAACRLSRAHFTRAFGATVGVAPYRWRMERRMALARQLLADTRRPYMDIASACGFSKMSHFSHAFTQAVGMCPRRWRQAFGSRGAAA